MSAAQGGSMLLISGPSGCGKSTICRRLLENPSVVFSVSATTRTPREGEVDGQDYAFLSKGDFRRRVEAGEFLEWAEVYGNLYGTLRVPMEEALAAGKTYLVEIDVQGALQLKALDVAGIYVFIAPPSMEVLRERLVNRGSETPESLERRLSKAADEYNERHKYDHVIVNNVLETALAEVYAIIQLSPIGPAETEDLSL